jgi:hypothetical protein
MAFKTGKAVFELKRGERNGWRIVRGRVGER